MHLQHHDLTNPVTQKGLADLQLADAILGQIDRHGGNIHIDDVSGQVRGIDDKVFSRWDVTGGWDHYRGLPSRSTRARPSIPAGGWGKGPTNPAAGRAPAVAQPPDAQAR